MDSDDGCHQRFTCFGWAPLKRKFRKTRSPKESINKKNISSVCDLNGCIICTPPRAGMSTKNLIDLYSKPGVNGSRTGNKRKDLRRRAIGKEVYVAHDCKETKKAKTSIIPSLFGFFTCKSVVPLCCDEGSTSPEFMSRKSASNDSIQATADSKAATKAEEVLQHHRDDYYDELILKTTATCSSRSFYSVASDASNTITPAVNHDFHEFMENSTMSFSPTNVTSSLEESSRSNKTEEYFSVDDYSDDEDLGSSLSSIETSTGIEASDETEALIEQSNCLCGFEFHSSVFSPEFPLITKPGVTPDSYEECLAVARSCVGRWETLLDRSDSLDPQYRCLGLGMMKRAVMNRLAIPLTMFLEADDSILHCWIHTPLGIRHLRSNLHHQVTIDEDPDAGRWSGVTHVVDFHIPWYCNNKPVRAIQQTRTNPAIGTCIESRCVIPDVAEKKVMLFQFLMYPKGKKEAFKADRVLKMVQSIKE